MFLSFEGLEGCGKSTQARRLASALGPRALLTREPGGTPLGRAIRTLLLDPANRGLASTAELLLYFADRAQHVAEVVRPALEAGRMVITDRYVDSSIAYQGYGRGIALDLIRAAAQVATGGLRPDVTVLLDVSVETGLRRAGLRGAHDRLESETHEFHERVRAGYDTMVAAEPRRWLRVDGEGTPEQVAARLDKALRVRGVAVPEGRDGVS